MGVLFDECAARRTATTVHLDRPFDIAPDGGTEYGAAALAGLVRDAAGWLSAAGAGRGDRVAILKDNHWDYDLLACAATRVGAVPAQLSAQLSPEALAILLERLSPAVLMTTAGQLERCRAAGTDLTSLARVTVTSDVAAPGAVHLDQVRGGRVPAPQRRGEDEPLVIDHTSGTTGVPKLVVHSTRTIIGELARFEARRMPKIGVRGDDVVATASSYAHGRTFCWTAVVMSMAPREVVILTGQDPNRADPVLRAHPPTIMEGLPASYVRFRPLTERLDNPFRRVRLYISTYDAVHPPTIRAYLTASRQRNPLWMDGWGQTETGPLTFRFHTRRSLARRQAAHDVGRPIPVKTRLRLVDPDTFRPVRPGRPGLVLARTAARCLDYLGETQRWADKQVGEWWITGDLGVRRWDGSVRLLDREVDRTPDGSCLEIEDALEDRLPEALECVLLAEPGKPPLPVIITADGTLSPAAWRRASRRLPRMREPVSLRWDEVPRTGTAKVRRMDLREQLTGSTATCGTGRWT
ncbi:Acyl-CoA synthetase (AMP-forming)/AMP-acid ligase II [Saccharopolyspora kobensis]|uniref:Acyl-CoA synthetase (AMP-forming)/AMP-acid ligase II n=2 Tax=Saccharopolyspora kobensis TaxID=146035 RepID=A0A1H6AMV9_9PSEU|nr:class I adenylate-forming enzyme family protein [Saccharopolyspora kobensis]SEG49375.1 Acyl-CoA synthetase (AMP-forming)/AMP-acid ligase II [Saccharopolyspora kobensis]SFE59411.1 Acyl-CoA synthetase (AMP-forming)/AMP-acid ligase II [Saccharopolyspora kobensis]